MILPILVVLLSTSLVFAETIIVKMKESRTAAVQPLAKSHLRPFKQPSRLPISIVGFRKEMLANVFDKVHVYKAKDAVEAEDVVERLRNEPDVEYAYIEPEYEPAVIRPADGESKTPKNEPELANWRELQDHLFPSPRGVDALFAWTVAGGRGENVKIADIEWSSWETRHREYKDNFERIYGVSDAAVNHGTAVLGEMIGKDDGMGITGIVPNAKAIGVSVGSSDYPTIAEYILFAAMKLEAGDVILLETHAGGPNKGPWQQGYVPMEYFPINFEAIKEAASRGIIVVEAAGNGGENLDYPLYERVFDRTFQDSGAIMVGASAPPRENGYKAPHLSRLDFSNNGSRIDVMGYGTAVTTTGYGDLFHRIEDDLYTADFGGTSSAGPIVAGAVAALQSMARATGRNISPKEMRRLVSASALPQNYRANPGTIGGLPDIKAAWRSYNSKDRVPMPEFIKPAQNQYVTPGTEIEFVGKQGNGEKCDLKVVDLKADVVIAGTDKCSIKQKFPAKGRYIVEFNVSVNDESSRMPAVREVVVDEPPAAPELSVDHVDRMGLQKPVFAFSKPNNASGMVFIEINRSSDFNEKEMVVNYRLDAEGASYQTFTPYKSMLENAGEGKYYARMRIRSGLGDSPYSNTVEFELGGLSEGLEIVDTNLELNNVVYFDGESLVSEDWSFETKDIWRPVLLLYDDDHILAGNPVAYSRFNVDHVEERIVNISNNVLISAGGFSPIGFYAIPAGADGTANYPYTTLYLGYSSDGIISIGKELYVYSNEGKIFDIDLSDPLRPEIVEEYDVAATEVVSARVLDDTVYFAVKNGIVSVNQGEVNFSKISEGEVLGMVIKDGRFVVALKDAKDETVIGTFDNGRVTPIGHFPILAKGLRRLADRIYIRVKDGFLTLSDDLSKVVAVHRTASAKIPSPFVIGNRVFSADGQLKEYRF